jgi:ABC-type oligopeptide transport system substrate-binding subunit
MKFDCRKNQNKEFSLRAFLCLFVAVALFLSGCITPKQPETYYGQNIVPQKQEFRWSDGGLPKIFDPTFAAVPPDTDAVRAMYEGLTDYDPKTLKPIPAVATKWESSVDGREWTFYLRNNARWSNGDAVTAKDFVQSWQRVLNNREIAPHSRLMANIVGAFDKEHPIETAPVPDPFKTPEPIVQTQPQTQAEDVASKKIAVEAVNDFELKVKLINPDTNFPSLVAHPVFRPIHKSFTETNAPISSDKVVTNGAFELRKNGTDGVVIEKAKNYWDTDTVNLERVLFVPMQDLESALNAYRAGEVDAVTNARFEPLGLKLLEPYKDFRKATFGALTYYRFNTSHKPFDDVRVREALTICLDRERINEDTLDGASKPANNFLPFEGSPSMSKRGETTKKIELNVERAKQLLAEAGFANGAGFPKIKLLVNRNDQQKRVAQAVQEMWKRALNVETEIVIKSWDEYEQAIKDGDYDIVRRGMVMQTIDETANMLAMFEPLVTNPTEQTPSPTPTTTNESVPAKTPEQIANQANAQNTFILTEEQALKELPAIPIYFSSSYSLVKPYIEGFDTNILDAPSLKQVKIKTDWKDESKTNPTSQTIIQ